MQRSLCSRRNDEKTTDEQSTTRRSHTVTIPLWTSHGELQELTGVRIVRVCDLDDILQATKGSAQTVNKDRLHPSQIDDVQSEISE